VEGICACLSLPTYIVLYSADILLLAPSQANLYLTLILPTCERTRIPRALDRPWTRPYETSRAILRHSATRPVASIATSATRDSPKTARTAAVLRLAHTSYARAAGTGLCIILEGLTERNHTATHLALRLASRRYYRVRQTVVKGPSAAYP
jgi:hypothetical protein